MKSIILSFVILISINLSAQVATKAELESFDWSSVYPVQNEANTLFARIKQGQGVIFHSPIRFNGEGAAMNSITRIPMVYMKVLDEKGNYTIKSRPVVIDGVFGYDMFRDTDPQHSIYPMTIAVTQAGGPRPYGDFNILTDRVYEYHTTF